MEAAEEPPFTVLEAPEGRRLVLRGEVRVDCVQALHSALGSLSEQDSPVTVDWSGAEHVDACVLQTLLAFIRARTRQKLPTCHHPATPRLANLLKTAGFARFFPEAAGAEAL